jgi:hypothetical protein
MRIVGQLWYGERTIPLDYTSSPRYRAVVFFGKANDEITATVSSTDGDPTTWVLDETFHTIGHNDDADASTLDSRVETRLVKSGQHYIVFRDYGLHNAQFVVSLTAGQTDLSTTDSAVPPPDAGQPGDLGIAHDQALPALGGASINGVPVSFPYGGATLVAAPSGCTACTDWMEVWASTCPSRTATTGCTFLKVLLTPFVNQPSWISSSVDVGARSCGDLNKYPDVSLRAYVGDVVYEATSPEGTTWHGDCALTLNPIDPSLSPGMTVHVSGIQGSLLQYTLRTGTSGGWGSASAMVTDGWLSVPITMPDSDAPPYWP